MEVEQDQLLYCLVIDLILNHRTLLQRDNFTIQQLLGKTFFIEVIKALFVKCP